MPSVIVVRAARACTGPTGAVNDSTKPASATTNDAATHHPNLPNHQEKHRCSTSAGRGVEPVERVTPPPLQVVHESQGVPGWAGRWPLAAVLTAGVEGVTGPQIQVDRGDSAAAVAQVGCGLPRRRRPRRPGGSVTGHQQVAGRSGQQQRFDHAVFLGLEGLVGLRAVLQRQLVRGKPLDAERVLVGE